MNFCKIQVSFLTIFLFISCATTKKQERAKIISPQNKAKKTKTDQITLEEYKIYRAVIDQIVVKRFFFFELKEEEIIKEILGNKKTENNNKFNMIVIKNETGGIVRPPGTWGSKWSKKEIIKILIESFLTTKPQWETTEDYLSFEDNNKYTLNPKHFSSLSIKHVFISEAELKQFQKLENWWSKFEKVYPKSILIQFSRVGFNKNHDEALLDIFLEWGKLAGVWKYVLLRKTTKGWSVVDTNRFLII